MSASICRKFEGNWSRIWEPGQIKIEDNCDGEEVMEETDNERYLGDVLSKGGKNIKK